MTGTSRRRSSAARISNPRQGAAEKFVAPFEEITPSGLAGPGVPRPTERTDSRATPVMPSTWSRAPARASIATSGPSRTRLGLSTNLSTKKRPKPSSTVALLQLPPLSRPTTTHELEFNIGIPSPSPPLTASPLRRDRSNPALPPQVQGQGAGPIRDRLRSHDASALPLSKRLRNHVQPEPSNVVCDGAGEGRLGSLADPALHNLCGRRVGKDNRVSPDNDVVRADDVNLGRRPPGPQRGVEVDVVDKGFAVHEELPFLTDVPAPRRQGRHLLKGTAVRRLDWPYDDRSAALRRRDACSPVVADPPSKIVSLQPRDQRRNLVRRLRATQ